MNLELSKKLEEFFSNLELSVRQKRELKKIIKDLKKEEIVVVEKSFLDYVKDLSLYKLFKMKKDIDSSNTMKEFIEDFFILLNPTIEKDQLNFSVEVKGSDIKLDIKDELTINLFNTIISANARSI